MNKTRQLGMSARVVLALTLLLLSLSLPSTIETGRAFTKETTSELLPIETYLQPLDRVVQATAWGDNFDSYATGVPLQGLGGWKGWDNSPAASALTTNTQAKSTPNSVDILPSADLVHEYSGFTSGEWIYTAWQYIPTGFAGESYFILLNQYADGGASNNWSVQVDFNSSTNLVENTGISEGTLPLTKGAWVELRIEIDLTNDTCAFYYGGQLLYAGTWTAEVSGGGISNIGAVDLFANGASSIYYDNFSLTPPPIPSYLPLILR